MLILITYDVATSSDGGEQRLRQVAKACLDYGQRVQHSVFECELNGAQYTALKARLLRIIDPAHDSLRFYHLGSEGRRKVEHHGTKPGYDLSGGTLIV